MVVTLGQQYITGEKPTVMLYAQKVYMRSDLSLNFSTSDSVIATGGVFKNGIDLLVDV